MTTRYIIPLIIAMMLVPLALEGQNSRKVRSLEQKRSDMLRKIERTDQELRKVKKNNQAEQNRLKLVRQQVAQRREVIAIIGQEMSALEGRINELGTQIVQLRTKERHLLRQYELSVRAIPISDPEADRLLFLFSSSSIDEAMQRQRFLSQYALATSRATNEIKRTRAEIETAQEAVNKSHRQKAQLLALRDQEKRKLEVEEGQRVANINQLKGQERKLSQSLDVQRRQAQQLEAQIQAQIAREIAAAEERARRAREARERRKQAATRDSKRSDTSPSSPKTTEPSKSDRGDEDHDREDERRPSIRGGYAMDAEERKLSGGFLQNKGRLPLPVRGRYDLVRHFGLQTHSQHSRVQISNGGIDLRVYADHGAYAVFNGVVSRVFVTPGFGQSIIVRHGNYLTVYSNLSSVRVSSGQRVSTGQSIGSIVSSGDRANTLHFQLWHERSKLNPEAWIRR